MLFGEGHSENDMNFSSEPLLKWLAPKRSAPKTSPIQFHARDRITSLGFALGNSCNDKLQIEEKKTRIDPMGPQLGEGGGGGIFSTRLSMTNSAMNSLSSQEG